MFLRKIGYIFNLYIKKIGFSSSERVYLGTEFELRRLSDS